MTRPWLLAAGVGAFACCALGGLGLYLVYQPLDLPAPATDQATRAVLRGRAAPDPAGLRIAVLKYVARRSKTGMASVPRRVCVDLEAAYKGGVPEGNWLPTAHELNQLALQGLPLTPTDDSCGRPPFPTLRAVLCRPERWWNHPDEFEVPVLLLYQTEPQSTWEPEFPVLIAVHAAAGWKIIREESQAVPNLYRM